MGRLGHLVLLGVHEQLLIQLFAGAQAGDLDLHVDTRLVAVKTDQAVSKIHDLDRFPHIQHIDTAALGKSPACSTSCAASVMVIK